MLIIGTGFLIPSGAQFSPQQATISIPIGVRHTAPNSCQRWTVQAAPGEMLPFELGSWSAGSPIEHDPQGLEVTSPATPPTMGVCPLLEADAYWM